ncbi:MAG: hypothetical protein HZA01_02225 [Nitrospinae bacterium]|nr:hypothetical protein [Nitrospinota bacterium]
MKTQKPILFFLLFLAALLLPIPFLKSLVHAAAGPDIKVRFNGAPAEVVSSSSGEAKVRVPLGASTGPISIETRAGVIYSEKDFEVNATPAPYNVSVKGSVENMEITWTPPIALGLSGYDIYRSTGKNGSYQKIREGTTGTFYMDEDPALEVGTTYYYKVGAVYEGNKKSPVSEPASDVFGRLSIWIPNVNAAREKGQGLTREGYLYTLQTPINVENADNVSIEEAALYLDYDFTALRPIKVERTILTKDLEWGLENALGTMKISLKKKSGKPLRGKGTLFNVVFEIMDTAVEGHVLEFKFHGKDHPDFPSYITAPNQKDIPLDLSNGAMRVQLKYQKGDVSGDTFIQADDSSQAFVYATGFSEPGRGPLAGGDIDGDRTIMTNDAGLILYHVVNRDWPSLKNIKEVFGKTRTVDMGEKTLGAKLSRQGLRAKGTEAQRHKGTEGQRTEDGGNLRFEIVDLGFKSEIRNPKSKIKLKAEDGNNPQPVTRNSSPVTRHWSLNERYLEVPLYINTLNDMHSGEFNVLYPAEILEALDFTLDRRLGKKFEVNTEFRKKGLAVVSLIYSQKGLAALGFKRTRIGVLKFRILTDKAAKGELSFSAVDLYDRFGRNFARSDLGMKVNSKKASFSIQASASGDKANLGFGIADCGFGIWDTSTGLSTGLKSEIQNPKSKIKLKAEDGNNPQPTTRNSSLVTRHSSLLYGHSSLDNKDPSSITGFAPSKGKAGDIVRVKYTSVAALISPEPGTTLASASQEFTWDLGSGVSECKLEVGSAQGGSDFDSYSTTSRASRIVPGLPMDGSPIYVRLSSAMVDGSSYYKDYTFTSPRPIAAVIVNPSGNSTLSSSSQTFYWSKGSLVDEYKLEAGSSQGGSDIDSFSSPTRISRSIDNLPVDGSKIYIRLSSRIGQGWRYQDYEYTAYKAPIAEITYPPNGSTLSSSAVTFKWDLVKGISGYKLEVGTSPGAADIDSFTTTSLSSREVSGLPVDGSKVYARLSSLRDGVWFYNDYYFTAFEAFARITSPPNGSTLSSSSVTFKWNLVNGISEYKLEVGTSPGAADIHSSTTTSLSSREVSGLPTDGSKVYVRLSSLAGSVWQYKDYEYTAYSAGEVARAEISSPAAGSAFSSTTVTFKWNLLDGVSQYKLEVGTSPGGSDLDSFTTTSRNYRTVSGLPSNGGTVYVRLGSLIGATWYYKEYTFKAMKK